MKACLVQVTSSCDIELLFFVFTLYDTKLNQTATPDEVEEVIIIMRETPTQEKFNSTSTLIMWQQTNSFQAIQTNLPIPNVTLSPCN